MFSSSDVPFAITQELLIVVFFAAAVLFVFGSGVISYHFFRYAQGGGQLFHLAYYGVSAVLLFFAAAALTAF